MENIYGINEAGIWKQAHKITHSYSLDRFEAITPQDCFNDIVLAAMELVIEKPEITEKSPAYLLIAATNVVRNKYAKIYHAYYVKKGYTTASLDAINDEIDSDHSTDYKEHVAEIAFTYDYETAQTVRDIIDGLDETGKQVAAFLYDGYKAADIARMTGMYPMQVSRTIANIRTQMEAALL